ncbi:MAG: hypothetical protein QXT53_01045 [Ignisphaera sp.]
MYQRIVVPYCGKPVVKKYSGFIIGRSEIAVNISYVYMSIADEALTKCMLIAQTSEFAMGFVGMGRVIGVGVNVSNIREGDKVIVYASSNGVAQSIHIADSKAFTSFNAKGFNDLEALIIATFSISKDLVKTVEGANVLIVGKDLSIMPFALESQLTSSKIYTIPNYTLWPDIVKGEHISIYDANPLYDVAVIATYDPLVLSLIPRMAKERATIIIHPQLMTLVRLMEFKSSSGILLRPMVFGDISNGIQVYEKLKDVIISRIKPLDTSIYLTKLTHPAIVSLQGL